MAHAMLFLLGMVLISGYIGSFFRKFDMSGLELWLPFGVIVTYAFSPFWGSVVGVSIMLISLFLFPRHIQRSWISLVFLIAILFLAARYFPVTQETFFLNSMLVVILFNVSANAVYILTGYDWFRTFRFALLSVVLNYIILSRLGWQMILWLTQH